MLSWKCDITLSTGLPSTSWLWKVDTPMASTNSSMSGRKEAQRKTCVPSLTMVSTGERLWLAAVFGASGLERVPLITLGSHTLVSQVNRPLVQALSSNIELLLWDRCYLPTFTGRVGEIRCLVRGLTTILQHPREFEISLMPEHMYFLWLYPEFQKNVDNWKSPTQDKSQIT